VKKILLMFITLFQSYIYLQAQNLVLNPSFEELQSCPDNWFDFFVLKDCFPILTGSPDVFNICCDDSINAGVPSNFFGHQHPRTGDGYTGLALILLQLNLLDTTITDSSIFDEQFGMKLKNQLIQNKKYCVSFFVSLANRYTNIATDAISMLLLSDSLPIVYFSPPEDTIYARFPQIIHPQINNPSGNIIKDTLSWIKIEGEFIAQGDEKYLYIGNFKRLRDIHWEIVPYTDHLGGTESYYYIDDVAVYPCDAPVYIVDAGKDTCISLGESVVLGSPSREEYLYWWSDGKRAISNNGSITVTPTQTTTYYLTQKDFKFDETRDSVTVTVGNCNGSVDYSHYDFAIYPNPNQGDFQVRFNTAVPDGAVLELYDLLGRKLAEYPLSGSGNIANINGVDIAAATYYATVTVPNVFKKSVKMVVIK